HRRTNAVDCLRGGIGLELRVRDAVELIVTRPICLLQRLGIVRRELYSGVELAELRAEAPGTEVALIAPLLRLVGVILATPVGAANTRAVPDIGRIAGTQQLGLIAFTTIPAA